MKTVGGHVRLTPRGHRLSTAADRVAPWAAALALLLLLAFHPKGW